jgi:hypothetical protein
LTKLIKGVAKRNAFDVAKPWSAFRSDGIRAGAQDFCIVALSCGEPFPLHGKAL